MCLCSSTCIYCHERQRGKCPNHWRHVLQHEYCDTRSFETQNCIEILKKSVHFHEKIKTHVSLKKHIPKGPYSCGELEMIEQCWYHRCQHVLAC